MAIVVSSMDLAERPRNQRPTDPPTTTQKPETTTEDTSNRILSLPNEEKCMKSKFTKIHVKLGLADTIMFFPSDLGYPKMAKNLHEVDNIVFCE